MFRNHEDRDDYKLKTLSKNVMYHVLYVLKWRNILG